MWKTILILFLFLTLGGLYVYQNYFMTEDAGINNDSGLIKIGDNALYAADQKPGPSVVINLVFISKNGYIVIHEDDNGNPGQIIGNTKILPKGESKGVVAGLTRPTVHGEALFAMLHEDSGDGLFSPNIDIPLRDGDGNIIFMRFYVDKNADEIRDSGIDVNL